VLLSPVDGARLLQVGDQQAEAVDHLGEDAGQVGDRPLDVVER
jgi:hypothetical protein